MMPDCIVSCFVMGCALWEAAFDESTGELSQCVPKLEWRMKGNGRAETFDVVKCATLARADTLDVDEYATLATLGGHVLLGTRGLGLSPVRTYGQT